MSIIKNKSSILPWSIDNIKTTPSKSGVYVLREATPVESIVYIGSTENLEATLKNHFIAKDISDILYFDWYETDGVEIARELERNWIKTYQPKLNTQ